jgi:hypothetical protein
VQGKGYFQRTPLPFFSFSFSFGFSFLYKALTIEIHYFASSSLPNSKLIDTS